MKKRGQITLFIILGIVIISVITIAIIMRADLLGLLQKVNLAQSEAMKEKSLEIKDYSKGCLEKVSIEALVRILAQGGYYRVEDGIEYSVFKIPYYLNNDKENVPSLNEIEKSLEEYIEENLNNCVSSYSDKLIVGKSIVDLDLGNNLQVKVKQKLSFKMEDSVVKIKSYNVVLDFDVKEVYNEVFDFFNQVKEIDSGLVGEGLLALKNDYKFYNPLVTDDEIVFVLSFDGLNRVIDYNFALKYPKSYFKEGDIIFDLMKLETDIVGSDEDKKEKKAELTPYLDKDLVNEMDNFFDNLEADFVNET